MNQRRKRILFLAEGITMAHFTRPAVLAEALDPQEWDVHFWTPKRFHPLLRAKVARLGDLQTLDPRAFIERLSRGAVAYSAETLRRYVVDELAIIRESNPDLVIGDYRLSLCVSAPVSGVPFASIMNAYWSRHYRRPSIVPELPITQWVSPRVLNPVFKLIRPVIDVVHARPLNALRRQYGLPRLSFDMRDFHTAGNLVLYPDIPELVPLDNPPEHHHFVGTCPWLVDGAKPAWWDEAMASTRPKVFVTLGSSGGLRALPAVLEALRRLSVTVILATADRAIAGVGSDVFVANWLPFEETARRCAAVVSHGGSSGVYPALSAAAPVLAIPANIDTQLSAAILERSGAGVVVRIEDASAERLRVALGRVLSETSLREAATRWAAAIAAYDTKTLFPDVLRRWFRGSRVQKAGDPAVPGSSSQERIA